MELSIGMTTSSPLKICAVQQFFTKALEKYLKSSEVEIKSYTPNNINLPPQPVDSGDICCHKRISCSLVDYLRECDFIVSIENGLVVDKDNVKDVCYVVIQNKCGVRIECQSTGITVPLKYYQQVKHNIYNELGLKYTVGEMIHQEFPEIPANNWMADKQFGGIDRKDQIAEPLAELLPKIKCFLIQNSILHFDDYPKPGVMFQDLSNILANSGRLQLLLDMMSDKVESHFDKIDVIVGLDSRGFIYGSMLAMELDCGFVMARKKGKLPRHNTLSVEYGTEYSKDAIEIMSDMIKPNQKVLVVDDLVATGGSLEAAVKLVEKAGGKVVGCFTVCKVDNLFEKAQCRLGNILTLL